jgi:hypothetical protein
VSREAGHSGLIQSKEVGDVSEALKARPPRRLRYGVFEPKDIEVPLFKSI